VTRPADIAHLAGHLQAGFRRGGLAVRHRYRAKCWNFLDVEGFVAAAAH